VVPLLDATKRWECPSCGLQHVTREARPHTPMHDCRALAGLLAPFVAVTGAELNRHQQRLVVVDREDYVGNEIVRTDGNGRPVMAVRTERADGSNDCHVFAPTATYRRD
jgi:hypothetical protein